jgi:hypothetical protein
MRRSFVDAGFQVVDCPTLTSNKKNSTDIHLVVAAVDLLAQPTRYDEVIILSSDSDYIPLLHHLRAHDRRTVVVAGGPTSPALARSCDQMIDGASFVQALLAMEGVKPLSTSVSSEPVPTAKTLLTKKAMTAAKKAAKQSAASTAGTKAVVKKTPSPATAPVKGTPAAGKAVARKTVAQKAAPSRATASTAKKKASVHKANAESAGRTAVVVAKRPASAILQPAAPVEQEARDRVLQVIMDAVGQSPAPVKLKTLGDHVRPILKGAGLSSTRPGWLKALIKQLEPELPGLRLSGVDQGYLYDPGRHRQPGST